MNFYASILMMIIVLLFIITGILLKSGKYSWLISGYSVPPEGQKGGIEVSGLRNFIAGSCFLVAAILFLAGIFDYYHIFYGFVISIAALFFAAAFMLIRLQKFSHNDRAEKRKVALAKISPSVIAAILVMVGGTLLYGSMEQKVEVDKGQVKISGLCGTTIDKRSIHDVSIIDRLPKIEAKRIGFDFADVWKGTFKLEGLGEGRLFINGNVPPFIQIRCDTTFVILNFRDTIVTRETYDKIAELQK